MCDVGLDNVAWVGAYVQLREGLAETDQGRYFFSDTRTQIVQT